MVQAPSGEVLLYEAPDGGVRVEVKLDRDTVWLTQRQMSELFETTPENVLLHLKNIYADGELEEPATAKDFLAVRLEGKRQVQRQLKHYNLDAIISVGYRVNSRRGVRFRQWATNTLREHLVRGYTLNRQRFEHNARELEAALAPALSRGIDVLQQRDQVHCGAVRREQLLALKECAGAATACTKWVDQCARQARRPACTAAALTASRASHRSGPGRTTPRSAADGRADRCSSPK